MGKCSFALATGVAVVCVTAASASVAHADPMPSRLEHLPAPGHNAASSDDAESTVIAPANLVSMPGYELRGATFMRPDSSRAVSSGYAIGAAGSVFDVIGLGLRVDRVTPPAAAFDAPLGASAQGADVTWGTFSFASRFPGRIGHVVTLGSSLSRTWSQSSLTDARWMAAESVTVRPSGRLAIAVAADDFTNWRSPLRAPSSEPLIESDVRASLAVRPWADDRAEIGLEGRYLAASELVIPRATAAFALPYVGRLYGDVTTARPFTNHAAVVASVGAQIAWEHFAIDGATAFGGGLGSSALSSYVGVSATTFTRRGIPLGGGQATTLAFDETPGARGHVELLQRLWALANDRSVGALVLLVRAAPADGLAHAEELADAVRLVRARGKKVLCNLQTEEAEALYVCANADRTVMPKMQRFAYGGFSGTTMYYGKLLDRLGIHFDAVRVSDHKAAVEPLTREGPSDAARADKAALLAQKQAVFDENLARYRHIAPNALLGLRRPGLYSGDEARAAGLTDGVAYDHEIESVLREMTGTAVSYDPATRYTGADSARLAFDGGGRVGLLMVDGDIVDGVSSAGFFGTSVGDRTIREALTTMIDDPTIRVIVVRVESPGGSVTASDAMWAEIRRAAAKKRVIVSMGGVAASGGYWISTAASEVYALPLTLTGSIGVFALKVDVHGLLDKISINTDTVRTGPNADQFSPFRGYADEERAAMQRYVAETYATFLERVSSARNMSAPDVDKVAQGRVMTGQEARTAGLVDGLLGLRSVLERARAEGNMSPDAPVVMLPDAPGGFLAGLVSGAAGENAATEITRATGLAKLARTLGWVTRTTPTQVQARSEWLSDQTINVTEP